MQNLYKLKDLEVVAQVFLQMHQIRNIKKPVNLGIKEYYPLLKNLEKKL